MCNFIFFFRKIQFEDDQDQEKEQIHLKVIVPSSMIILRVQVSYFDSGTKVKEKILRKLEDFQNQCRASPKILISKDIHAYSLVRSSTKTAFKDTHSIFNNLVRNEEEFLLLSKRVDLNPNELFNKKNIRGPTEIEINHYTRHLPQIRSSMSARLSLSSMESAFFHDDLQQDLRKILAEIAKYSAFILSSLPLAEKLIKYYRQKILTSLNNHQDIVRLLMEMGFSRKNVLRALKLNGNNYSFALDWLMENVLKESDGTEEMQSPTILKLSCQSFKDHEHLLPSTNSIFFSKHKAIVSTFKMQLNLMNSYNHLFYNFRVSRIKLTDY